MKWADPKYVFAGYKKSEQCILQEKVIKDDKERERQRERDGDSKR